jgi:hypothetical protein
VLRRHGIGFGHALAKKLFCVHVIHNYTFGVGSGSAGGLSLPSILKAVVPQSSQTAFCALRPLRMVTSSDFFGSKRFLHLRQYMVGV